MHRCRIDRKSWGQPVLTPAAGELERLQRVLRLGDGDTVAVFDGHGRTGLARLTATAAATPALVPLTGSEGVGTPPLPVLLFAAIPKSTRMDWLVEKATELGVLAVAPLLTERGIVRPGAGYSGHRLQRWRRIAEQAARQCGLAAVPAVASPVALDMALARAARETTGGFYGSLEKDAVPLRDLREKLKPAAGRRAFFIGPEGDFTPAETGRLRAAGMAPVTLGPRVLRVETAAVAALCLLGYELQQKGKE